MNRNCWFQTDDALQGFRAAGRRIAIAATTAVVLLASLVQGAEPPRLIAHWPLLRDARDVVGALHGTARNVEFRGKEHPAAHFNGRDGVIEVPDAENPRDAAHVFRYAGGTKWIDCGRLGDDPNHLSVQSMIVHQGKLYAGTGIWDWERARGEQPGKPAAAKPRLFVYEGGTKWRDLGQVGDTSRILSMASFKGELYIALDRARPPRVGKCFKYAGTEWVYCGSPDGKNFENLLPLAGTLYGVTHGGIYRYEGGEKWECIAREPFGINQVHSLDVYGGQLHAGTWPQGYVLRYEGNNKWTIAGRMGLPVESRECNEINDLTVYNGKLYAGVLPKGEAYRYESDGHWTLLASLGHRPDFVIDDWSKWCRLTAMASYGGKLFAGTGACRARSTDGDPDRSLGRVYAIQAGQVVSHERDIGGGWTHLVAVRRSGELQLFVNGQLSARSTAAENRSLDVSNSEPLTIGFGVQNYFTGAIADLRLYGRALSSDEVQNIQAKRTPHRLAQSDLTKPYYRGTFEVTDPQGVTPDPKTGDFTHLVHGSAWGYPYNNHAASNRNIGKNFDTHADNWTGFRVVVTGPH
jgi:hypothetical protein